MVSATNKPQFLYLDTVGWRTNKRHQIEIWFVEYDGKYYLMSERGEHSHWVQNIVHHSTVSFSVNGRKFEGIARTLKQESEPELAAEVAKLMNAKYLWDDGLIVELRPTIS